MYQQYKIISFGPKSRKLEYRKSQKRENNRKN